MRTLTKKAEKRKQDIRQDFINGVSARQLRDKYRISESSVRRYIEDLILLKKNGCSLIGTDQTAKAAASSPNQDKDHGAVNKRSYLSLSDRKKIVSARDRGQYIIRLACEYNVSECTIRRLLARKNNSPNEWVWETANRNRTLIVEMHREGQTSSEIAKRLGISLRTVYRAYRLADIYPSRERAKDLDKRNAKITALFDKGTAVEQIALKTKLTVYTVRKILRKSGRVIPRKNTADRQQEGI